MGKEKIFSVQLNASRTKIFEDHLHVKVVIKMHINSKTLGKVTPINSRLFLVPSQQIICYKVIMKGLKICSKA